MVSPPAIAQAPDVQKILAGISAFGDFSKQFASVGKLGRRCRSWAYWELALVYPADNNQHGIGPACPTTPGHFDSPVSCTD